MIMGTSLNEVLIFSFVREELSREHNRALPVKFLDLGCGDLRYKVITEDFGWWRVFADFHARTSGVSVECDAHRLPFKSGVFDVVLFTEVLEHLSYPERALAEIARIMRPGGSLILTVPFLWGTHEAPHDYFRFTEFGLARALDDAGLELVVFQRRADLIGVLLAYLQTLYGGVVEFCARKRWLGPAGFVLGLLGRLLRPLVFGAYVRASGARILKRCKAPGSDLKGVGGQLNAWPLGFHVVCRRR